MKKTDDKFDLSRFKNVQSLYYKDALEEIKRGRKETQFLDSKNWGDLNCV